MNGINRMTGAISGINGVNTHDYFYEQEKNNENSYYSNLFIYQSGNEDYNHEEYEINYCNDSNGNKVNDKLEEKTRAKTNKEDYQNEKCKKNKNLDMNNMIYYNNVLINIQNEETKNTKKKCGRKRLRTDDNNKSEHNKFSDDNIRRKCKHLVLKYTLEFINNQIKRKYEGNIGNGIFKKELQTLNQSQKSDATIIFNQNFLTKSIGDIFSEKISGRFTNFPPDYNKLLIEKLRNENDEDKKKYFNKLFDITFIECLRYFSGEDYNDELKGLKRFNDIKNEIVEKYREDGEEYIDTLFYYLKNYEEIINNKKARKPRKTNKLNNS